MARAAALSTIEDLPADMRRLTDTMLAEHEAHLTRDREVRNLTGRIQENCRRWPELGWAASAQGLPVEKLAEHAAWREEGARLEAEARDMLGPDNVLAPYLEAQPGVRRAIRKAAQKVREALQHERYRAFGWLAKEVNRQARETRTEAFHVPRYGETIAQAEALSEQADLPPRTRELVDSWLDYHARCEPLCLQIRDWPALAEALTADCPERPATLASLSGWRQRAEPLLAEARAMLAEDSPHGSHLAAIPGEREALVEATSSLEQALLAVKARETKLLLSADVQRSAKELHRDWEAHVAKATAARVDPFYVPGHQELIDRLQELRQHPAVEELPEPERNRIESILRQDTHQTEAVSHVDIHLAEVQRCRNHLRELHDLAHTYKLELEEVPSYDEWHDTAERLLAAGKAIADDRKTYGPCLDHVTVRCRPPIRIGGVLAG